MTVKDNKKSETSNSGTSRRSKNADIARRRRIKITAFLHSFREVSPIVNTVLSNGDIQDKNSHIIGLYSAQKRLTNSVLKEWGLSRESADDAYTISRISGAIGNFLSSDITAERCTNEIITEIASKVSSYSVSTKELSSLVVDNMVSTDVIVNVKAALLFPAINMSNILFDLKISPENSKKHLMWLHKTSVLLAKDMAFNWDKESLFKDREALFQTVLPQCAEMVFDAWHGCLIQPMINSNQVNKNNVIELLPNLMDVIDGLDMGYYSHDTLDIDWLKEKITNDVIAPLNNFSVRGLSKDNIEYIKTKMMDRIDLEYSHSWRKTSESAIEEINSSLESMSDSEIDEWELNEGSEPMSITPFLGQAKKVLNSGQEYISIDYINLDELEDQAKGRLAVLWGLSDAVFKLKGK